MLSPLVRPGLTSLAPHLTITRALLELGLLVAGWLRAIGGDFSYG